MTCRETINELSRYLDDETSLELRDVIDGHLARCHQCKVVFESTKDIIRLLQDDRLFGLPAGFSTRLRHKIDALLESTD